MQNWFLLAFLTLVNSDSVLWEIIYVYLNTDNEPALTKQKINE